MKGIVERDDDALLRAAGGVSGGAHQLQRAFDRFGAAVGEEGAIESRLLAELLRQQALILVVVEVREVNHLRRLVADDLHDPRMRVSERIHAQAGKKIKVALAIDVPQVNAFAARHGDGITGIGVQQIFLLARDDFLISGHDEHLGESFIVARRLRSPGSMGLSDCLPK